MGYLLSDECPCTPASDCGGDGGGDAEKGRGGFYGGEAREFVFVLHGGAGYGGHGLKQGDDGEGGDDGEDVGFVQEYGDGVADGGYDGGEGRAEGGDEPEGG